VACRQDVTGAYAPGMAGAAYFLDAVRTPFGRYGGALGGVRPDDLATQTLSALLTRSPGLDLATINDVVLGDANGAGSSLAGWSR
jgi:acetyl-CoA acetyltransferase